MKRLLSILLSIAMCASLLPMTALAAKENPNETVPYYFCDTEGELFEDEFYFDEENNTFYLTGKSWSEGAKVSLDEYDKEFVTMTESEEPSGMKFTINVTEIETEETIEVEVDDYTLELDLINDSTEVFFCREVEIEEEGIEEARQNLKKLSLESGESVYVKFYSVKPSQMKNAKTALDLVSGTFDQGGVLTISHEEKYEDVWFIEAADEINDDVNLTLTMTGTGENETYTMPVTVEPLEDGDTDNDKEVDEEDNEENEPSGNEAPVGGVEFEYNRNDYQIAFYREGDSPEDPDGLRALRGTESHYREGDKGNNGESVKHWIKVLSYDSEAETTVYTEESKLYNEISFSDIMIAKSYDDEDGFKPASSDPYVSKSFEIIEVAQSNEDGEYGRWYVEVQNINIDGEYYLALTANIGSGESAVKIPFAVSLVMSPREEEKTLVKDLTESEWTLEEINDYIASDEVQKASVDECEIILNPAKIYEGSLELSGEKIITIDGNGATLKGDVNVIAPELSEDAETAEETPCHSIINLNMVSKDEDIDDADDIGVHGTGNVSLWRCNLSDYHIAVQSYELVENDDEEMILPAQKIAAHGCWFKGNSYGVYFDGHKMSSELAYTKNHRFEECRFEGNNVGVYIKDHIGIVDNSSFFMFDNCEFVNNKVVDIKNESEYQYYAIGCYFGKTESDDVVAAKPEVADILVSYVYDREFLTYEIVPDNGSIQFISGVDLSNAIPVAPEGMDEFWYKNSDDTKVDLNEYHGTINLTEDNGKKYQIVAIWHVSGGGQE